MLLHSDAENYPATDGFLGKKTIFQMTVGTTHDIKGHKLKETMEKLGLESKEEFDFIFLVPKRDVWYVSFAQKKKKMVWSFLLEDDV